SESVLEASPLNRVLEQGAPGKDWKADPNSDTDHTLKFDWDGNDANEVMHFKVTFTNADTEKPQLVKEAYYPENVLRLTITKDENWQPGQTHPDDHTTREYTNHLGQVILKRTFNGGIEHDTYYVYDSFGNLSFTIPPKVVIDDGISQQELDELCYQYKFDYRNRPYARKVPGKDWEYTIYNKLDQPIMTQDGNQRANNEWLFTKFDVFGREAYTGKITDTRERSVIQDEVSALTTPLWVESSNAVMIGGTTMYYNNGGYPNAQNAEVLTIYYYNNYEFLNSEGTFFSNPITVYGVPVSDRTKTLSTGSKVKVLGTSYWTTTATYYDNKARVIYVASTNEYLNTSDIVENKLDFVDKIERTKTTHRKGNNTPIITEDIFEYDHMGRLTSQTQKIDNQDTEQIVANEYDELGQLVSKNVGGLAPSTGATRSAGLQTVDYTYNVRGWLKGINDVNNLENDLFGFAINYNQGTNPLYNGNISETSWKTANDNVNRWYNYEYDALNRITAANSHSGNFDVSNITYDKMGNIESLNRVGHLGTSFGSMDVLSYTYDSGNKLLKVIDTGNKTYGFKDGTNTNDDFAYDDNGNMIVDQNKGISSITYNHLNLPETVSISNSEGTGTISYIYDATGAKQKKIVTEGSSITTEYAGNYIYKNGNLEFFNHPEGIVEKDADGYKYVYQFKDHNGNVRLSYSDNDNDGKIDIVRNAIDVDGDGDNGHEIKQVNDYYPFGGKIKYDSSHPNSLITGREHQFKYNGQELEESLGLGLYEMDWRLYDPWGPHFTTIDPLADHPNQFDKSPYMFAWGNPVMYGDPTGLCPDCPDAADYKPGDTYDVNGTTYVVDNDGQWAREGGVLDTVVIGGDTSTEEADSSGSTEGTTTVYIGRASSIGNLRGWNKFSAEAQVNMPWLFGRRTSDDGRFFVDPAGNPTGVAPMGAPVNLPFGPGGGKNLINGLDDLIKAATKADKGALTKVGRALQKHGSRPNSVFPKATGNPASMNVQGEAVLRNILTNPSATTTVRNHARFGDILEVKVPGGGGARFSADGNNFIGFIE
ncbi:hypothetical protein J9332_31420, partial [Aquimarina celericrescens]|nr:hypothetical protein [Aquimarina celericrescens]